MKTMTEKRGETIIVWGRKKSIQKESPLLNEKKKGHVLISQTGTVEKGIESKWKRQKRGLFLHLTSKAA